MRLFSEKFTFFQFFFVSLCFGCVRRGRHSVEFALAETCDSCSAVLRSSSLAAVTLVKKIVITLREIQALKDVIGENYTDDNEL